MPEHSVPPRPDHDPDRPESEQPDPPEGFDAVILAGGSATRLGGTDKPALRVGGQTLLDAALTACAAARRTVVVGPVRTVVREVVWAREEPAGAGPAAALAAGLAECASPYTVVLAADLPFIDTEVVHSLWITIARSTPDLVDGAVAIDESGRAQWLTACYRHSALLARVDSFSADQFNGLSLRRLLDGLRLVQVEAPARSTFDCDTWAQIAEARGADGPSRLE